MLKKLFKYDFLWINKLMPYFYIAVIAAAVIAFFTNKAANANQNIIGWLIVDRIFSNVFISACFTAAITVIIRCGVHFKHSLFKDESYLTHTLPVSKKSLFAAKTLSSLLSCIIALAVIAIGVMIPICAVKNFQWFIDIINTTSVLVAIVLIEEIFTIILCIQNAIIFSNRFKSSFKGCLIAVILYFATALFVFLSIGALYLINNDVGIIFTENINNMPYETASGILKQIAACSAVSYGIADALLYLIGIRTFNKGVNID